MSTIGEVCTVGSDAAVDMVRATIAAPNTRPAVMVKHANFFMTISIRLSWILSAKDTVRCFLSDEAFGPFDKSKIVQDKPAEFGERAPPLTAEEKTPPKFTFEKLKRPGQ
jgi:hypothetical protein